MSRPPETRAKVTSNLIIYLFFGILLQQQKLDQDSLLRPKEWMHSETCSRDPKEDVWSSGGGEGTGHLRVDQYDSGFLK